MRASVLLLLLAACRTYVPQTVSTGLLADEFRTERYEVPGYRCLRKGGVDPRELPGAAVTPGEAAVFDVIYPKQELNDKTPLVFMPHGNSLEFIEDVFTRSVKQLRVEEDVTPYYDSLGGNPEQSTRSGAEWLIDGTKSAPVTLALVRAGAVVVIPGNCWGDGGHGTGERGAAFFDGERLGGSFDASTWQYAKDVIPHSYSRELAVVCSGGGRRAIEMMQRTWWAFDAVVLDSPADDVTAFLEEPRPELLGLAGIALDEAALASVFERFWTGIYGSREAALKSSLADEIDADKLKAPVYLAYSSLDPVVTAPVTRRLAEAMSRAAQRAPDRYVVQRFEQKAHCQLRDDESIAPVLRWLDDRVGGLTY